VVFLKEDFCFFVKKKKEVGGGGGGEGIHPLCEMLNNESSRKSMANKASDSSQHSVSPSCQRHWGGNPPRNRKLYPRVGPDVVSVRAETEQELSYPLACLLTEFVWEIKSGRGLTKEERNTKANTDCRY